MYSMGEDDQEMTDFVSKSETPSNLEHLRPRLEEYLALVDPSRVPQASKLLSDFSSEDELFSYLALQYGNTVKVDGASGGKHDSSGSTHGKSSSAIKSASKSPSKRKPKLKSRPPDEDEAELSDFIVANSEDEEPSDEEDEESEFEESESDVDEPEPDLDLRKRKRRPGPPPPPSKPPMPTTLPPGPTIVCKYGKDCYRKNPVHFQEFAHPWLLNKPPH
jgi:hypothetical protein